MKTIKLSSKIIPALFLMASFSGKAFGSPSEIHDENRFNKPIKSLYLKKSTDHHNGTEREERKLKIIPYAGGINFLSSNFNYNKKLFPGISMEYSLNGHFSIGLDFNKLSMTLEDKYYNYFSRGISYNQWSLEMYSKFFLKSQGDFRPYGGLGIGYKNLKTNYKKLNFYESYFSNNKGIRSHSFFASAIVGAEYYFSSQFGLNAQFKYSQAIKSKLSHNQDSGGKLPFYNNFHYHGNESKLEQAAKDSGSIDHQSIYLGLIIKL